MSAFIELLIAKIKYKLSFGQKRKKRKRKFKILFQKVKGQKQNKFVLVKENGQKIFNPTIEGLEVIFYGKNSVVEIQEPCNYFNCILRVGSNNQIKISGTSQFIHNLEFPYPMREGSKFLIGKNLSCVGCKIFMHDEPDTVVRIGDDCMISFDVIIWPSDGHAIIGKENQLLNPKEDIYIGNHVWLGMGTTVLKGSYIPDNSVLAAKSVFTRKSNFSQSDRGKIFAGIPAKLIKTGDFTWYRENCFDYKKTLQTQGYKW